MNVKAVSLMMKSSMLAAGLTMAAGCTNIGSANKMKQEAAKYLNENELQKAEEISKIQPNGMQYDARKVAYWDSILIEAKAQEAYYDGIQHVKDSIHGFQSEMPNYKSNLDTIQNVSNGDLVQGIKRELAFYVSGKEMSEYNREEPRRTQIQGLVETDDNPYVVHYWSMIAANGKAKEAYKQGIADETSRINDVRNIAK